MEPHRGKSRIRAAIPPVAATLAVTLWVAGFVMELAMARLSTSLADLGHTKTVYDTVLYGGALGATAAVGAVLVVRRPGHPVGWLMAALSVIAGLGQGLAAYATWQLANGSAPDTLTVLGTWTNYWYWTPAVLALVILIVLLFPDGHLPSRRWRPVAVLFVTSQVLAGVLAAVPERIWLTLGPRLPGSHGLSIAACNRAPDQCWPSLANPIGLPQMGLLEGGPFDAVVGAGALLGLLAAVLAVVVRFRRARGIERQQLRWLLTSVLVVPVAFVPLPVRDLGFVFSPALMAAVPVSIGVAVLRHRLYEIDRIVSRTVTYAVVIAVLAAVYAASVVGLGSLLDPASGASDIAVAGSTLAVAALFRPVLRRVRSVVDRRFNRSRYDAAVEAGAFAVRLRNEVDLEAVTADLRATVTSILAPVSVSLWLRDGRP
jgi:MFS family permease